ncbi:glucosyl transferase [Neosynechococcus sphagnicola sy1]|uniref:Glucosyl transferase n=2 Tax=Neosynechococcus TaxID=1501143 RepID=A0A098TLL3_9CYAN|nr:glucosyl transferase [Neosynechococcus sphagnicola sy1]
MKILLVCSTGGHFRTLHQLHPFWQHHERVWVTFRSAATETALAEEQVYWAWSPTNRHLPNLIRNFLLSWQVLFQEHPDLVLSTGAGVAVPFLIVGKLLGCQTVFIESITRVRQLSLSARLVLPFLDALYVQWPELLIRYPQAEYIGTPSLSTTL